MEFDFDFPEAFQKKRKKIQNLIFKFQKKNLISSKIFGFSHFSKWRTNLLGWTSGARVVNPNESVDDRRSKDPTSTLLVVGFDLYSKYPTWIFSFPFWSKHQLWIAKTLKAPLLSFLECFFGIKGSVVAVSCCFATIASFSSEILLTTPWVRSRLTHPGFGHWNY